MTSLFGPTSTTDEVLEGIDLRGQRILVTGASAGLGVETCRALAAHGAEVIGLVREEAKGQRATAAVSAAAAASGGRFELVQGDLADLASLRRCSDALLRADRPLHAIIANAGVMACPEGRTADGFEMQFGTNHLGHFLLVNRLVPLMRSGGRIVNLSSAGHRFADVDLDDPAFRKAPYDPFVAYGRSKTANILFSVELDRRLRSRGIRASAVHPGVIQTELGRHMTPEMIARITSGGGAAAFVLKTVPQGAATSVWSGFRATADQVGGRYCEDCHVAEITNDALSRSGVRAYALDPVRAEALWTLSETLVKESFHHA
jgi:NAD(P)-dependent dehydrogenase (short-subunit alcohol dehydrogenase family)